MNPVLETLILAFKKTLFYFNFLFMWRQSRIFSINTPVFSVTWSFRNHFNMQICCSGNISY